MSNPYRTKPTLVVINRDIQIMDYPVITKGTQGTMTHFYPRSFSRRSEVHVLLEGIVYLLDGDSVDVVEGK